jgi:hypothetical protein
MDVLEIENATLCGLSMGGYVVLSFTNSFALVFAGLCWRIRAHKQTPKKQNKAAPNKLTGIMEEWQRLPMRCCRSC